MPIFTPPPPFFFTEHLRSRAKLEAICWSICVSLLLWKDVDFLEALHIIQWGNVSGGSSSFLQRQQWHSRGQNCKSNFQRCVILILSRSRSAGLYLTVHFVCFRRFSSFQDVWGSWRSIEYPTGKLESILPSQNTKSSFFPRACLRMLLLKDLLCKFFIAHPFRILCVLACPNQFSKLKKVSILNRHQTILSWQTSFTKSDCAIRFWIFD